MRTEEVIWRMTPSFASSAQARAQAEHKPNGFDDRESFRQAGVIRNAPDVNPKVRRPGARVVAPRRLPELE